MSSTDPHPFDTLTLETLRTRPCIKWTHYDSDVLPLWVADMDFPTADPIAEALAERARSGNLGYPAGYLNGEAGLPEALLGWLETRHGWQLTVDDI